MARSEIHAVIFNCSRSNGRAIAQTPPPPKLPSPVIFRQVEKGTPSVPALLPAWERSFA